ncbi:MAG TPA: ice-binding family protein [Bryobacteraceae bacterium]|nr:ice-binding family protein [Bryobacteraceae bacterium]
MKKLSAILVCSTFAVGLMAAAQAPVSLGSAANFAVLAGSTVTSTGASQITGDLGVSPGTAVTGFPPGIVTGTMHAGGVAAALAIADLTTAFNDAAGRTVAPVTVAGNLGGQTLAPGLYKSTSSLAISSGNLTLDAKGDASAVFIFQMASTLTTTAGLQVILAGGAQASNIFWQVGSSATLGTNSIFQGTIMANQSITLTTGATLNGRALARIGGVSLQSNAVTKPAASITTNMPAINQGGVVNLASYLSPVVAGSLAAVFGTNLSSGQDSYIAAPLPTTLAGSSFEMAGRAGVPLVFASPAQVNLQIPWELAGSQQASAAVTVGANVSPLQNVTLAAFAPGIFTLNQQGSGQGAILIANTAVLAGTQGSGRAVKKGEYISIFCTGLGAVNNQPATGTAAKSNPLSHTLTTATVTIGGAAAIVTYSGLAPGFAGLYQVDAQVPSGAPSGGTVAVVMKIGGSTSNTATIAVQ